MYTIFASEVPGLLGLDKFHKKETIIPLIIERHEKQAITNIHVYCINDDIVHDQTKTFTKKLTNDVIISGRIQMDKDGYILIERSRQNQLTRKIWPNDACLAQVYLWLVDQAKGIKYIEQFQCETFQQFICRNQGFEESLRQSIVQTIQEFLSLKNNNNGKRKKI